MSDASPVTDIAANEAAPDTTDAAQLAAFCDRWHLDARDPAVVRFLDLARRDGARHADWSAGFRCWVRDMPQHEATDDLDPLDLPSLAKVGLDELGMPVFSPLVGLAPATCARIAAGTATLAMTMFVFSCKAPELKAKIRAARQATPKAMVEQPDPKKNGNGAARRP